MAKRVDPTAEAVIDAFVDEVENQSDRGTAIVAASVLDALLERVLIERLVPLSNVRKEELFDGPNKPLGSFSAKIEMAFALGIMPEAHRRLFDGIRKTRNAFAHSIESLKFDDPEIGKIVKSLGAPPSRHRKAVSIRTSFLSLFQVAITFLFLMLDLKNVRVEPVWKTHKDTMSKQYGTFREMIEEAIARGG